MPNRHTSTGGRYTRPRRGFRARSHYKSRLKKRGISNRDVKMESLGELRKRQGYLPGPTDGPGSEGRSNIPVRGTVSSVPMQSRVRKVASNEPNKKHGKKNARVEQSSKRATKEAIR
jgi:hypothetical protein